MGERFAVAISMISLVFSCVSAVVAGLTAFFAFVRRPQLQMTRPTFVALAFDGPEALPKVFTRMLLFATGDPGKACESMFARVQQAGKEAVYSFWSYAQDGRLVAGGGLFVGKQGIVTDHHFVLGKGLPGIVFVPGVVRVEICARIAGEKRERCLCELHLSLTAGEAAALNNLDGGVHFERSPDGDEFIAQIHQPLPAIHRA